MMIIFQRKIIYMGYVPLGARTEELGRDIRPSSNRIMCDEVQINGERGARLFGIYLRREELNTPARQPKTVMIYFQGNAGNPLGRIPVFERLLLNCPPEIGILAVAPRSYWKSTPRTATERGLLSDYHHALSYAINRFPESKIILYGHSLGGAIAVCLAARLKAQDFPTVKGLVLENPFASIPGMVKALYPQRWLPYHYLSSLVLDKWDALSAMQNPQQDSLLCNLSNNMMVMLSEKDELVPTSMGRSLLDASKNKVGNDLANQHKRIIVVRNALHEDAWTKEVWLVEMRRYLDLMNCTQY
ncbi:unnamed protein product [Somion occarium]